MFAPATPEQRETILSLIAHAPDGVALEPIAMAVGLAADDRKLKQWVSDLIEENLIYKEADGRTALYLAVDPVSLLQAHPTLPTLPPPASPVSTAPVVEATPPATPARDPVEELLGEAIPYIVADCGVPLSGARTILRTCARSAKLDGAAMSTFMDRAMVILSSLTEDQAAAKYGIDAQEYAVWREHCRLAGDVADSSRDEPLRTAPDRTAPGGSEPLQTEPGSSDPLQAAANRNERLQTEPIQSAPSRIDPLQSATNRDGSDDPIQTESNRRDPIQTDDDRAASTRPATARTERTVDSSPSATGTSRSTPTSIVLSAGTIQSVASVLLGAVTGGASARWTEPHQTAPSRIEPPSRLKPEDEEGRKANVQHPMPNDQRPTWIPKSRRGARIGLVRVDAD